MARSITPLARALKLFEENPYPEDRARRTITRGPAVTAAELAAVERELGWSLPEDYRSLITSVGPFRAVKDRGESDDLELLGPRRGYEAWTELSRHLTRWLPAAPFEDGAPDQTSVFVVTRQYDGNRRFGCLFYAEPTDGLYSFHEKDGVDEVANALETRLADLAAYLAGWDTRTSQWVES